MAQENFPLLGFGLGLRSKHYPYILEHLPKVDFFEIISENFMGTQGKPRENLTLIKEHYPIVMHGVSLSIGTIDPINTEYLDSLKELIDFVEPAWISDHLCWTGVAHKNTHDLLPVPYTKEALKHIVSRIEYVQDYLGRPIALENPSTYLEFKEADMTEAEFLKEMVTQSGCNLLLDVNNIYVTCYNHQLSAQQYIDTLPLDNIAQIHLAGHLNKGTHIIDTHDDYVCEEVWNLYKYVLSKMHYIPNTMIEWDDKLPDFPILEAELHKAKAMARDCHHYELPNLPVKNSRAIPNNSISLEEIQEKMQDTILKNQTKKGEFHKWIIEKDNFSSADQMNVYVNGYRYRLFDITAEDYPTLKAHLGEESFENLIESFIEATPSQHFNIAHYTMALCDFIKRFYPNDVVAFELCDLETQIANIFNHPEGKPLTQEDLAGLTPEDLLDLRLHARPSLKLLTYSYDINEYYAQVMNDEHSEIINKETIYLALFRHEGSVWRMPLEKREFDLLEMLFSGASIGEALDKCSEEVADKIFNWFSRWKQNGLLASCNYAEELKQNRHMNAVA